MTVDSKSKWVAIACPSVEESFGILLDWPDNWWTDKQFIEQELLKYPECVMVARIGKTCLENDPDGPPSCHCAHCNLSSQGV